MATTKLSDTLIGREVERLFGEISGNPEDICMDPVIGVPFLYGDIEQQREAAYRRLLVREYFALNGPPDAPLMPADEWERDRAKHLNGPLGFVTAHFIWSMEMQDDLRQHPSFADFASGMLWQHDNNVKGYSLRCFPSEQLAEMKRRYPPRKLEGLDSFRWHPPQRQKQPKQTRRAA